MFYTFCTYVRERDVTIMLIVPKVLMITIMLVVPIVLMILLRNYNYVFIYIYTYYIIL